MSDKNFNDDSKKNPESLNSFFGENQSQKAPRKVVSNSNLEPLSRQSLNSALKSDQAPRIAKSSAKNGEKFQNDRSEKMRSPQINPKLKGRSGPMSKRKKIIIAVVSSVVFILVVVSTVAVGLFLNTVGSVQTEDVHYIDDSGPRPPTDPDAGNSVNLLMIGVDSRDSEENKKIGGDAKDLVGLHNSDTTILMHISSNRSRIDAISIPRDTIINSPACSLKGGKSISARKSVMFNSVFFRAWNESQDDYSAGQCVQKAVESLTNLRVDYLAIADFAGFQNMVDSLNGVDICVQEPINAPAAGGLILPKGMNHLDGFQAISYARARHGKGLGDQSDLSRIQRQQKLVGSIIKTALSKNFTDVYSLTAFVQSAAKSIKTTMPANKMLGLMWSLKNIHLNNIVFIMTPVEAYKYNKNRVVFSEEVQTMWNKLKKDIPLVTQDQDAEPEENSSAITDDTTGLNFRTAFGADSCEQ